jgi:integrase
MPLTDIQIRNAKPGLKPVKPKRGSDGHVVIIATEKAFRLHDTKGLYLEVAPSGGKYWRFKYKFPQEKRISLGVYPEVSLAGARELRDEKRKLVAKGIDPSAKRKAEKSARADRAENSFEIVAREFLAKFIDPLAECHSKRVYARFENDVFPQIGARPIEEIAAPELLKVIQRIETRGAVDTAHRTLGSCGQVFRYGISTGRCTSDITRDLRGSLTPVVEEHFAAATTPQEIAGILRAIEGYQGTYPVQCALRLAPIVFVRPGELRKAKWADFDLDNAEWTLKLSKRKKSQKSASKKDDSLIVPLPRQAMRILKDLNAFSGGGTFVFPGGRDKNRPLSDNAVLAALRRLGIPKEEMCGHGFRATARTIIRQELHIREDLIEHQLGHEVIDPNGRAYNRTTFLAERRLMLQTWADYLDKLKSGKKVPSMRAKRLTDVRSIMVGNFS